MSLNIKPIFNNIFPLNTFIVFDENKEAFLIDPGFNTDTIEKEIISNGYNLTAILITHPHQDHIYSLEYFKDKYNLDVYMSKETNEALKNPNLTLSFIGSNLGLGKTIISDTFNHIEDNHSYTLNEITFKTYKFPGHSQGCTIFEFEYFIITGDFIFKNAIGRIDFEGSDINKMKDSLLKFKEIFKDSNKALYPAHNEFTTIQNELMNNPYLQ